MLLICQKLDRIERLLEPSYRKGRKEKTTEKPSAPIHLSTDVDTRFIEFVQDRLVERELSDLFTWHSWFYSPDDPTQWAFGKSSTWTREFAHKVWMNYAVYHVESRFERSYLRVDDWKPNEKNELFAPREKKVNGDSNPFPPNVRGTVINNPNRKMTARDKVDLRRLEDALHCLFVLHELRNKPSAQSRDQKLTSNSP